MTSWSYQVNQWNVWQRCFLLFAMVFTLWTAWYFFLEKPLLANNKVVLAQQVRDQKTVQELSLLTQLQGNFVYKNSLQPVLLRQVFQDHLLGIQGLAISQYNDDPVLVLPAGASQFTQLQAVLGVSLLSAIQQLPATVVFSSEFNPFVAYLKALQSDSGAIYFDSVEFNMKRYPTAVVTMKVFTLGG